MKDTVNRVWYVCAGNDVKIEKETSGVYLITEVTPTGEYVWYVGKGEDISERFWEHLSHDVENQDLQGFMNGKLNDGLRIHYTVESRPVFMKRVERTAFDNYGGVGYLFNRVIPEGEFLSEMNFPRCLRQSPGFKD